MLLQEHLITLNDFLGIFFGLYHINETNFSCEMQTAIVGIVLVTSDLALAEFFLQFVTATGGVSRHQLLDRI